MTGNMTSDLIPEMGAEEEENKIESNTEMKAWKALHPTNENP